jgi:hypothetical protein
MYREARHYAKEAWREVKLRHRLYPEQIQKGKMTAAVATRKIRLIREVATVFLIATQQRTDPLELRFPIRETGPGPLEIEINDLTAHIDEVHTEIRWRERLLVPTGHRDKHIRRLELMGEILEILLEIQRRNAPASAPVPN